MPLHLAADQAVGWVCRDYRWEQYPARNHLIKHPQDNSLMTYRGHKVLTTLIRAYFSPMHTTAQRFIYAGSADGSVYIYGEAVQSDMQQHCIAEGTLFVCSSSSASLQAPCKRAAVLLLAGIFPSPKHQDTSNLCALAASF